MMFRCIKIITNGVEECGDCVNGRIFLNYNGERLSVCQYIWKVREDELERVKRLVNEYAEKIIRDVHDGIHE